MSSPHDPDELIARLAAEESSAVADPTLAPLRAELDTLEDQIRQPRPPEPLLEESAYQRAAAQVVELGRELSHATRQQLEEPAAQPLLGELGHYKLLEKLGEGGMGAVYKAVHTRLKRVVALKVLPKERLQDEQAVARFQREMWAVGTLQHPNIVAAHDAGEIDGTHYLVMELVEGIDLGRLVSERGPLPINAACELIRQAALGLQHAYEHNLVHRDIKPSNLMLAAPPNAKAAPTVKILDLGLALLDGNQIDAGELTSTGQVMGTLDYMAPEQGTDTHSVDIRADIYSLGASLYKLLTGRAPFGDPQYNSPIKKLMALANQAPKPVESLRPDCPPELAQLVARMLAKSPDERPAPPEELAAALEPFAQGADLHALLQPRDAAQVSTVNRHEHTVRTQHTADDPTFVPTGPVDASAPTRMATTQISQTPARSKRRLVLALGGMAAALVLGVVIVIATDQGTIEIEGLDDPAAQVQIKLLRNGADYNPNWRIQPGIANSLTVRSGNIEVQLPGDEKNEYEFVGPTELRVKRGERKVFTLRRKPAAAPVANTGKSQPVEVAGKVQRVEIPEPPPLVDWLKGRKVLTVAQDGSGQFKTIQAALDALQPGEAVQVLDKGPYRERLHMWPVPKDTGLFSEAQTVLELPEWQPTYKYRDNVTGADVQVYEGHRFESADGFRLNGFEMFFPGRNEKNTRRLVMGATKSVVLENCRIHASEDVEGEPVELSDNDWAANDGVGMTAVVRDCILEGSLALGTHHKKSPPDLDRRSTAVVVRNYFAGTGTDHHVLLGGQSWARVLIQQNVFAGKSQHDVVLGQIDRLGMLELSNNTLESVNGFGIGRSVPTGSVVIRNNLRSHKGLFRLYDGAETAIRRVVDEWIIDHNSYPDVPTGTVDPSIVPRARGDLASLPRFFSKVPQDANFLRLKLEDPAAAGGAGGEWPRYIGALPPGPAPQAGDWFTRLRERWGVLDPTQPKAITPVDTPEPPPIADWLKGRKVLTVAQDGSGEFKTIQAALNALQTGQVVKVLDRGTYRERLEIEEMPADTGLVASGATLELPDYVHSYGQNYKGHHFFNLDGFRISGFTFVFPKPVHEFSVGFSTHRGGGLVVENCWVKESPVDFIVGFHAGGSAKPAWVRECGFESRLHVGSIENPKAVAVVRRNLFLGPDGSATVGEDAEYGKFSFQHNIFLDHRHGLIVAGKQGDALEISNNTFAGGGPMMFISRVPQGQLSLCNNLHIHPGLVALSFGAEAGREAALHCFRATNCYPRDLTPDDGWKPDQLLPKTPTDLLTSPEFLSKNPSNRDYLRLNADGPAGSSGSGGSWPTYIGALPPGPAPAKGDWFTRLQEKWMGLAAASPALETKPLAFKSPEFELWAKEVAELAAPQQVQRVSQKLVELNPGFDGELEPNIEAGTVLRLKFHTDHVTDISPVRALPGLRILDATGEKLIGNWPLLIGTGKLSDLSPLKGLKLEVLEVGRNSALSDLAPVAGMQLTICHCEFTSVSSLEPLRGMQLKETAYSGTRVADISPLKGMPITYLLLTGTQISELSALAGMPLKTLAFDDTRVSDLAPLKGIPLESLNFGHTAIADLAPLKGMRLRILSFHKSRVADLAPLHGMPLKSLGCLLTPVSDLTPLEGMELEKLTFTPANVTRGIDILRGMKSLRTIGAGYEPQWNWPPEEFWKKYDAGEFGKPEMPPSGNKVSEKPVEIPEPPLLAEWLKGRTVLTVAQDGSGQFKSIQAALDALKKGQVVKVLDRGPYREQLKVTALPADCALISEVRTIIDLPQATPRDDGSSFGHYIRVKHGLRIHGIGFKFPDLQNGQGILFDESDGLVLENCQFRIPTSEHDLSASVLVYSGVNGLDKPLVIRDCRFDGPLHFEPVKPLDRDVLITRNYFTAESDSCPIALAGAFRKLAVRHNVFEGKRFTWVGLWDTGDSQSIEFSRNTLVGMGALRLAKSAPQHVAFIGNLFAGHCCVMIEKDSPAERVGSWQTDRNYYQGHIKFGDSEQAPLGPTDCVTPFRFLSKPPGTRDYARLPKPEAGGKDAIPEGVGALPTGPAPVAGDWFTRLQESWFDEPRK